MKTDTELTFALDHLTESPVPLYEQRSPTEKADAFVTIDRTTGRVSTYTRFVGDAWPVEVKDVERVSVPRDVRGDALAAFLQSDDCRALLLAIVDDDEEDVAGAEHELERQMAALDSLAVWQAEDWLGEWLADLISEGETIEAAADRLAAEAMMEMAVYVIGIEDYLKELAEEEREANGEVGLDFEG